MDLDHLIKEEILKKFLALIGIFILCSFPALTEDSLPVTVDLTMSVLTGAVIDIENLAHTWSYLPPLGSESGGFFPSVEGSGTFEWSSRFVEGNGTKLILESAPVVDVAGENPDLLPEDVLVCLIEGIAAPTPSEFPFPSVGTPYPVQETTANIVTRDWLLTFKFMNKLGHKAGTYTSTATFTVIDVF